MSDGKYQIKSPTMALFLEDGRQVARVVPKGAIIKIDSGAFTENKLVDVAWNGEVVMMFAQDVRSRGKRID
jgi:hypothetical protein